jgi:hypothetical protein
MVQEHVQVVDGTGDDEIDVAVAVDVPGGHRVQAHADRVSAGGREAGAPRVDQDADRAVRGGLARRRHVDPSVAVQNRRVRPSTQLGGGRELDRGCEGGVPFVDQHVRVVVRAHDVDAAVAVEIRDRDRPQGRGERTLHRELPVAVVEQQVQRRNAVSRSRVPERDVRRSSPFRSPTAIPGVGPSG